MTKQNPTPRFAICINTDDPDLLTPRSVYEVLPAESAAKSKYVRVVDGWNSTRFLSSFLGFGSFLLPSLFLPPAANASR